MSRAMNHGETRSSVRYAYECYYDWAQLSNCPVIECRVGLRCRYYRIANNDILPTRR